MVSFSPVSITNLMTLTIPKPREYFQTNKFSLFKSKLPIRRPTKRNQHFHYLTNRWLRLIQMVLVYAEGFSPSTHYQRENNNFFLNKGPWKKTWLPHLVYIGSTCPVFFVDAFAITKLNHGKKTFLQQQRWVAVNSWHSMRNKHRKT